MPGLFGNRFHKSENALALRLNGWTKLSMCILVSVVTLFITHNPALVVLLAGSTVLAMTQLRLRVVLGLYLFICIMGLLSVSAAHLLSLIIAKYSPALGQYSLYTMITPLLRMITVMQIIAVTALSTSPQEILTNLKTARLPRFLYLPVVVMLRFVPSFFNDMRQINESLKIRDLRITFTSIVTRPILTMRCSVIPLIFRALRASDELAIASEIKGVGHYPKPTSFRKYHFGKLDKRIIVVYLLFFSTAIGMQVVAPEKPSMRHGRPAATQSSTPAAAETATESVPNATENTNTPGETTQ